MIDHVGLIPAYIAVGTALAVLLVEVVFPGRRGPVCATAALGIIGAGVAAAVLAAQGHRDSSYCFDPGCSFTADRAAAGVAGLFALLTLVVLAFSVPMLRSGSVPVGEYCFLLCCSMAGGVALGGARDLVILIVAVETLTLPLYILVGLRRSVRSAEASVTFFVASVIATAVALLGVALLYASTGTLHLVGLHNALNAGVAPPVDKLVPVGITLLISGLAFKVAAVPLHAWAAKTYDGAPLPIAGFLSTASKLGGVVAILLVSEAVRPKLEVSRPVIAILATLTMTVGNLVALRQKRLIRLLAWSSIAQAGYILAPLVVADVAASATYAVFFVLLEIAVFGVVIALRGAADGGTIDEYRGVAKRSPWLTAVLMLAIAGLAGLPPGLAGLFAKAVVVRSLLGGNAGWLAVVVSLNAVIALAYYIRLAATFFAAAPAASAEVPATPAAEAAAVVAVEEIDEEAAQGPLAWPDRVPAAVGAGLVLVTVVGLAVGFAPQLVMDAAHSVVGLLASR